MQVLVHGSSHSRSLAAAHLLSFLTSSARLSLPLLSGSHSSKSWFSRSALSCALGTSSPSLGIALRLVEEEEVVVVVVR